MPRINIEDSLYLDGRFTELNIILKSKWAALGALIEAWSFAQRSVEIDNPCGLVSVLDWKKRKLCDHIINVGLAEIRGDKIYLCGAQKEFAWLVSTKIKGQKGGLAKASSAKPGLSPSKPLPLPLPLPLRNNTNTRIEEKFGNGEVAKRILLGIKKYGPDDYEKLRDFVSVPVFDKVRNSVGWSHVRGLKSDQWTIKNIIDILEK